MASDSMGTILKVGLLGGAAYVAWNLYRNYQAPAPAPAAGGSSGGAPPPPPAPPAYQFTPPTITTLLQNAIAKDTTYAAQGQKFNADQWIYYYNLVRPNNQIPASVSDALFWPNGRPSDPTQEPLFDLPTFVTAVAAKGFSGLGCACTTGLSGRGFGWNYVPASVPMVRSINYVRRGF